MIMDYWSDKRLNHHTEATTMLYGARECARIVLQEGLEARFDRHAKAGAAVVAGVRAMGLTVFGDDAHRMSNVTGIWIPEGIDGERVRLRMREDFEIEIGTAFGPLVGKIWRIGAMGYNARKHKVLITLGALEAVLRAEGFAVKSGAGVEAALAWPNGAKIAVQFVINYEEGGENNILHGDKGSEAFLSEMVGAASHVGARSMAMESLYEYGSRAGFWRLHQIFTERNAPVTVYGVALAMARNPQAVEAMRKAQWEIASHGYKWIDYQYLPEEIEREHIAR
eukprot:gene33580-43114_t